MIPKDFFSEQLTSSIRNSNDETLPVLRALSPFIPRDRRPRKQSVAHIMNTVGGATSGKDVRKPFYLIREKEISREDKGFLGKMMRLDPRDRPTAGELLRDEWFEDEGDDFPSGSRLCNA